MLVLFVLLTLTLFFLIAAAACCSRILANVLSDARSNFDLRFLLAKYAYIAIAEAAVNNITGIEVETKPI